MEPAMEPAIRNWVNWLTINRSAATVSGYGWELRHLAKCFPDKQPGDFNQNDLLAYLANRRKAGCGDAAIKRTVNALKSFFIFTRQGDSPAVRLPAPRPKKRLQRTLTFAQAFAVLAACDTSSPIGARDLAIMTLMLDSGIRAAEACRLTLDKLDLSNRLFRLVVKGGQEGFGTFSLSTANCLARWLSIREGIAATGVASVFVSIGGLKPGHCLTTDGLRRIFRKVGTAAGLKQFSPHDLRRSFATMTSLLNAPTRWSQIWGRWGNLQEFERYTQALMTMQDKLRGEFERYSPVRAVLGEATRDRIEP